MHLSIVLLLVSIGALASAYTAEHVFGLLPCILCIYQRIPYMVVAFLALCSICVEGQKRALLLLLSGLTLWVGAGIALVHVGVENGVIQLEEECVDQMAAPSSLAELRNTLVGTPAAPCDEPAWVFFGLSMAGWNFFFSFLMGLMTLRMTLGAWKAFRRSRH